MTDKDLDTLEALAQAATPGPWRHPGRALVVSRVDSSEPLVCDCLSEQFAQAPKDAAFIAAANPATVLKLIAELRRSFREKEWLAKYIANTQPDMRMPFYEYLVEAKNAVRREMEADAEEASYIADDDQATMEELREKTSLLEEIYDGLGEKDGACPVCHTYTHKHWCWYPKLSQMLGKPLDSFDAGALQKTKETCNDGNR